MAFEELLKIEKEIKPYTAAELKAEIASIQDDADYLFERYQEIKKDWPEYHQMMRDLFEGFLKKLLGEKARFARVFQTERGSYYFQLASGECWRMKREVNYELRPQIITEHLYFVVKSQGKAILSQLSRYGLPGLIDFEIKVGEYEEGAVPLEVGHVSPKFTTVVEESEGKILIKGVKSKEDTELDRANIGALQVGHSITEIIK